MIASVVAELSSQLPPDGGLYGSNSDCSQITASGAKRTLHVTPNRFTRTSSSRTWNTGNGSPDAVCFSVDRGGVFVVGCCVYGGMGAYEFELEILQDDQGGGHGGHAQVRVAQVLDILKWRGPLFMSFILG